MPIWLTTAGAILGIIALGFTAIAVARSAWMTKTVEVLQDTVNAQESRAKTLETAIDDRDAAIEQLKEKLTTTLAENRTLGRLVTGQDALEKMTAALSQGFLERQQADEKIIRLLEKLDARVTPSN
jgi:stalled ribosome rescue protein Dom34